MSTPTRTTCRWACRCRARARSRRVATGVAPRSSCFAEPAEAGAQMLIVHHGLFWNATPVGSVRARRSGCTLFDERPVAGRLPPGSGRPPGGRKQRADLPRARARDLQGFGGDGERTIGFIGQPNRRSRPTACSPACARRSTPIRSSSCTVPSESARSRSSPAPPPGWSMRLPMPAPTRSSPGSRTSPRWPRAGGRDPLRRRRPLRHRGVRVKACWESWSPADLASNTASSTSPTRGSVRQAIDAVRPSG